MVTWTLPWRSFNPSSSSYFLFATICLFLHPLWKPKLFFSGFRERKLSQNAEGEKLGGSTPFVIFTSLPLGVVEALRVIFLFSKFLTLFGFGTSRGGDLGFESWRYVNFSFDLLSYSVGEWKFDCEFLLIEALFGCWEVGWKWSFRYRRELKKNGFFLVSIVSYWMYRIIMFSSVEIFVFRQRTLTFLCLFLSFIFPATKQRVRVKT
jgi:hypothetical protein